MNGRIQAAEIARLSQLKASLSDDEKQTIIASTQSLQESQLQQDDESILP